MNYSVNPVRPQVSAGRILAAGWFYALSVVLFALDIAHASLFLGSSWLNNPPTDLDFYGWGFIVFIGLCFVGFYYVRDLTPAIDVEGDPLRFSREGSARHFALTGLVLAMPLVLFEPGDPLYMFSAGLMVVQAMVDALLVRDVRQAIPHAKRPTVLLRAMLIVTACYGLAALLGFELVALLLRVAVAVLAPVAEGLPLELCDLGDETLRGEAHELNRELRRVTWACGGLLALMLADMLLGVSEMAWVLGLFVFWRWFMCRWAALPLPCTFARCWQWWSASSWDLSCVTRWGRHGLPARLSCSSGCRWFRSIRRHRVWLRF